MTFPSLPGVFGLPATCRMWIGPRSEQTEVGPLNPHPFHWCLILLEAGEGPGIPAHCLHSLDLPLTWKSILAEDNWFCAVFLPCLFAGFGLPVS